ncbi:MAG: DUF1127 domain-containing protein [Magnetovibrio sp.]|nr:DUF1127 domain-containing protein [Magnetovibrio sp.]
MNTTVSSVCCRHAAQAPVWVKTAQNLFQNLEKTLCWSCKAIRVQQQRNQLAKLSIEQLEDIGLSQEQAQIEAKRAFWDLP